MTTLVEYLNSQFSLAQNIDFFIRILAACLCGALIGFERSKRFKEAGIRTHIIVCCAAAVMMIVSKYAFADLVNAEDGITTLGTKGADPSRIASQVITGVSFLGAGMIFRNGSTVKGLTTAAGVWATAGIGLCIGAGMYTVGFFATIVIWVFQMLMHRFRVGTDAYTTTQLTFTVTDSEEFRTSFNNGLKERKASVAELKVSHQEDGLATYTVTLRSPQNLTVEELDALLHASGDVHAYSITPSI